MATQGTCLDKTGTFLGSVRVRSGSGTGKDSYRYTYMCGNCLAFQVNAAYDFWGSDHIVVTVWRYSISERAWKQTFHQNYMDGKNRHTFYFAVNRPYPHPTNYQHRYDGSDSIHFCIGYYRIGWGMGNDKGSSYYASMSGIGDADNYDTAFRDTLVRGKKGSGSGGGVLFNVSTGLPLDPFTTEWGDVTAARGSLVLASDPYRLISVPSMG